MDKIKEAIIARIASGSSSAESQMLAFSEEAEKDPKPGQIELKVGSSLS